MQLASPRLLPSPLQVLAALYGLIQDGFLYDVLKSVYRIAFSFALAVAFAYPMGLLIGTSASLSAFFSPLISAFRYLPAPAFVPLLLMWLGAGDGQKVALLFLGVVWFLITIIADHVRAVPRELVDTARTLGADTRQIYFTVIAPSSWPRVWDALRQMLAVSWTYLVIAEIVAATDGIGAMMMRAQRFVRVDDVMAGILTIGILGVLFDLLFRAVGRRLFRYETIEQERR
jgi:NitT/TauT family transport system permease protein